MKIRSGFVSNSSSSSFIVKPDITTSDLALIMLNVIMEDRKEWCDSDDIADDAFDRALEWLHENPDFNEAIVFPWSVNENTYIWLENDGIHVSTCNNNSWYSYIEYDYMGDWCAIDQNMKFRDLSSMCETTYAKYGW